MDHAKAPSVEVDDTIERPIDLQHATPPPNSGMQRIQRRLGAVRRQLPGPAVQLGHHGAPNSRPERFESLFVVTADELAQVPHRRTPSASEILDP
ncbi:hypothetical protein [Micromonospora carbonacea]|uniref:hypothetical protein n=1 Tax=Micromonospora carbonacea TaxID=47853 RepID=UPI00371EF921